MICKKIRSLRDESSSFAVDDLMESNFTRVIFCASEKMIKRFVRAHNKIKSI